MLRQWSRGGRRQAADNHGTLDYLTLHQLKINFNPSEFGLYLRLSTLGKPHSKI